MTIDDYEWRPITFKGETLPATLMAISVLGPMLDIADEDLIDWLWRLSNCRGFNKGAPAERCSRCAHKALDLMLEHRQSVIHGISDRLAPHGFDAEATYRDWITALQRIVVLSKTSPSDCVWSRASAPG